MVAIILGWVHVHGLVARCLWHDTCPQILILERWSEGLIGDSLIAPLFVQLDFNFCSAYCSGSSVRASQPFPLMETSTGCFNLSRRMKPLPLSAGCWSLFMSYPTDQFSFFPTDSTGDDAGTDPVAAAPRPASHESAHCPAPPQATVAPPSIDDLWQKAFENYGLKRPTEVTEIHVFRVILQSHRDKHACTRSVTKTGPLSDPIQTLEQIIEGVVGPGN